MRSYTLDKDNNPVLCGNTLEWGKWFEKYPERRIVQQDVVKGIKISTVFLGLDHSWSLDESEPPVLWETMVFANEGKTLGDMCDLRCERYTSHQDARDGHAKMLLEVDDILEELEKDNECETDS